MSTPVYLTTLCVLFGTILAIFGFKYCGPPRRPRACSATSRTPTASSPPMP